MTPSPQKGSDTVVESQKNDEEKLCKLLEAILGDLVADGEMAGFMPPEATLEIVTQDGKIGFLYKCPFGKHHIRSVRTVADQGHMHSPAGYCGDDEDYFRDFMKHLLKESKIALGDLMRSLAER